MTMLGDGRAYCSLRMKYAENVTDFCKHSALVGMSAILMAHANRDSHVMSRRNLPYHHSAEL